MKNYVVLVISLLAIVFRKKLVRDAMRQRKEFFGLDYGPEGEKRSEIVLIITAIAGIISAVMGLLGIGVK